MNAASQWVVVGWLALGAVAFVAAVFAWTWWAGGGRATMQPAYWRAAVRWMFEAALWVPVIIIAILLHLVVGAYYLLKRIYVNTDEAINEMLKRPKRPRS